MNKIKYFQTLTEQNRGKYINLYSELEDKFKKEIVNYSQIEYGRANLFITYGGISENYICDFRHFKTQVTMYFYNQYENHARNLGLNEIKEGNGINNGLSLLKINDETNIDTVVELMVFIYNSITR